MMDHWNIKVVQRLAYVVGSHPRYHGTFIQTVLLLIALGSIATTTSLVIALFIYEENLKLLDFTEGMQALMFCLHILIKLLWFCKQHDKIIDLLKVSKQFWNVDELIEEDEKKQILKYLWYLKTIMGYFLAFAVPTSLMIILRPLLQQGTLPFKSYIPENKYYYYPIVVVEQYTMVVIYCGCISFDAFFGSTIVLMAIQFKMLNKEIQRVLASTPLNEKDQLLVRKKLKRCIEHHNFLLNFVKKINNTISLGLLLYIGVIILSNCVEFFAIVSGQPINEFVKSLFYIISLTNQFVAYYIVPGQLLTAEAEKMEKVAFESQWYRNLKFNKPIINMISCMGQRKVHVHAFNVINLSFASGLQAYKTIISYYMFLRTMNRDRS
ncbi:unnamed protein product [Psylliodes chrysocephalus]|uniref:Odorant receptor n=1 Tax=Psylliodes chrysocephalus TaxID=3402493 RepID=A0A9P0CF45_9CUCU|nr:unnamed protein product [Psylliodes chrysocephala]